MKARHNPANDTKLSPELLNYKLNELRLFLGHLENYSEENNVAFSSLKHLGIWLLLFALVNKDSFQDLILQQAVGQANIPHVKALIEELIRPENLTQIINDFQQSHGEFTLDVAHSLYSVMQVNAEKAGLTPLLFLLLEYITPGDLKDGFALKIKNEIRFNWAETNILHQRLEISDQKFEVLNVLDDRLEVADEGSEDEGSEEEKPAYEVEFRGKNVPAFLAERGVDYAIIEYKQVYYHVSRFNAQASESTKALPSVFMIQAAESEDQLQVQQNYYSIIKKFPATPDYAEVHAISNEYDFRNLSVRDTFSFGDRALMGDRNNYTYSLRIEFPRLNGCLKTTERRLGMYEFFSKCMGPASTPLTLQFSGERSLEYDDKAYPGTDQQKQTRSVFGGNVNITYEYDNTFMLVYVAPHAADYIPFQIADPVNLELKHSTKNSIKKYPQLIDQRKWDDEPDEIPQPETQPATGPNLNTQEASRAEEKIEPVLDITELFKKIYRSIEAGKSSFFKSDFLAGKEGLSRADLLVLIAVSTDKDVKQAWAIAHKYRAAPITHQPMFSEIYLYAFDQSHIFSRAKVDNQFFYSKKSLLSYVTAQHNGIVPRKNEDQIEENSRTDRIITALRR